MILNFPKSLHIVVRIIKKFDFLNWIKIEDKQAGDTHQWNVQTSLDAFYDKISDVNKDWTLEDLTPKDKNLKN